MDRRDSAVSLQGSLYPPCGMYCDEGKFEDGIQISQIVKSTIPQDHQIAIKNKLSTLATIYMSENV